MVRGVNKRIVEVSETGNEYFEKAILFLRPSRPQEEGDLEGEAKRYLRHLQYTPPAVRGLPGRIAPGGAEVWWGGGGGGGPYVGHQILAASWTGRQLVL